MPFLSRRCSKCKVLQPLENYRSTGYRDGISKKCNSCISDRTTDAIKRRMRRDPRYRLLHSSYCNAIGRGIEHTLKLKDIPVPTHCIYLGCEINWEYPETKDEARQWNNPSIDRIDSTRGYTPDNIQVISDLANRMKTNATVEQMLAFADGVYRLHGKDKE